MTTKLEKPLKREIEIGGQAFIVTLAPDTLSVVGKGRRKGLEIRWDEMVSGDAALAAALQASVLNPTVRLEPSARNARQPRSKDKRSKKTGAR